MRVRNRFATREFRISNGPWKKNSAETEKEPRVRIPPPPPSLGAPRIRRGWQHVSPPPPSSRDGAARAFAPAYFDRSCGQSFPVRGFRELTRAPRAVGDSREDIVFSAKLAETSERYDEMQECMRNLVAAGGELNLEERNMLSIAYKSVVNARRSTARMISALEAKETDANKISKIKEYRTKVEKELGEVCNELIGLLNNTLIPGSAANDDAKVFYLKMKGDYWRYLAEIHQDTERTKDSEECQSAYSEGIAVAKEKLPPTHSLRLGIALNYSVYMMEILGSKEKACDLAQSAFDDAVDSLDSLPEEQYRESSQILQLLRDNLQNWAAQPQAE